MATISGTLKNASGVRPNTKIILTAYKTTSDVVTLAPDTTIITDASGNYSFVCNPSFYNVRIQQPGYPCENVGIIQVYSDSMDGTINDFLTVFKPDDLTPEILKQCLAAKDSASESARIAQEESGKVVNATKLGLQVNNLHTTRDAITWAAGLYVEDPAQLYVHDNVEYLPSPKTTPFPFTTGATFNADNWVLSELATTNNTIYKSNAVVDMKENETVMSMYSGGREFTSKSRPVITNATDTLINQTYRTNCDGFDVEADSDGAGTALGTDNKKQSTWAKTSNMLIRGQRFGIWKRYSIWEDYDNLSLKGNTCGIRLARSAKQNDNSNPESTSIWNLWDDGYFHNVIKMNNVLCEGGEVGIYASLMCGSLDNITCQGQMSNGSSNDVLPTGMKGTGIYLENGKNGTGVQSWNNSIRSYYCENTMNGLRLENRAFTDINGYYYQPHDSIAGTALELDNSYVMMRGFCSQGTGKIANLVNGSVLVNEGKSTSAMLGTKYSWDATSQVYLRGQCDLPFSRYTINVASGTKISAYTLPMSMSLESRYDVFIIATYDGYLPYTGSATVTRHLGSLNSIALHPKIVNNSGTLTAQSDLFSISGGFTISVVSNKIVLTMKSVASSSIRLSVQIEEVCGTETVINAPVLLGVVV